MAAAGGPHSERIAIGTRKPRTRSFDIERFLSRPGPGRQTTSYRRGDVIFSQGEPAHSVMHVQSGSVKLSVVSSSGKGAVVGLLGRRVFW